MQASTECHNLKQQLAAVKARATETARQLSAARTAAKEANEVRVREQHRAVAATVALKDLEAEVQKLQQ
jgi:hypothetical protein